MSDPLPALVHRLQRIAARTVTASQGKLRLVLVAGHHTSSTTAILRAGEPIPDLAVLFRKVVAPKVVVYAEVVGTEVYVATCTPLHQTHQMWSEGLVDTPTAPRVVLTWPACVTGGPA